MTVIQYDISIPKLDRAALAAWEDIPAAVASDCMGRGQAMTGAISPLDRSMRIVAQARTVQMMAADNSPLHVAVGKCAPGEVLVCDGHGFMDSAVFGGLMCRSACEARLAGLVIDGAVRDSAELDQMEIGVRCLSTTPKKSAKDGAGKVDVPVRFGGVTLAPGNWLYSDPDGVLVSEGELSL